jgi:hypothetical protein
MNDHRLPRELCQLFPDGGKGRTLPVSPPPGDVVWPDPGYTRQGEAARPAFWMSDAPATGEDWARMRACHPHSELLTP